MKRAREEVNWETAAKEWERTAQLLEARALAAEERLTTVTLENEALVEQLRLSRENTERERENVAQKWRRIEDLLAILDGVQQHVHSLSESLNRVQDGGFRSE
jgi:hypothetical protein